MGVPNVSKLIRNLIEAFWEMNIECSTVADSGDNEEST